MTIMKLILVKLTSSHTHTYLNTSMYRYIYIIANNRGNSDRHDLRVSFLILTR